MECSNLFCVTFTKPSCRKHCVSRKQHFRSGSFDRFSQRLITCLLQVHLNPWILENEMKCEKRREHISLVALIWQFWIKCLLPQMVNDLILISHHVPICEEKGRVYPHSIHTQVCVAGDEIKLLRPAWFPVCRSVLPFFENNDHFLSSRMVRFQWAFQICVQS